MKVNVKCTVFVSGTHESLETLKYRYYIGPEPAVVQCYYSVFIVILISSFVTTHLCLNSRAKMSLLSTTRVILSSYGRAPGRLARFISLIKPPGTPDTPDRTVGEVVRDLTETVIGGPASYDPELYKRQRERLIDLVPKSQEELVPRRMTDSFDQAIIPLGSDAKLRDRYTTFFGGVRVGRLLEDMDIFAVHLVFKHMLISGGGKESPQSPFSIVTALVDSIDVRKPMFATQDIKMMGHVTWVSDVLQNVSRKN